MTLKQTNQYIATHARFILEESKTLANLIQVHTQTQNNPSAESEETTTRLSPQQIHNAFNGPYSGFYKYAAAAYAKIAKLRMMLTLHEDDNYKELVEKHSGLSLPQDFNFTIDKVKELEGNLDQLVEEQQAQWNQAAEQWQLGLIEAVHAAGLNLSELEQKELLENVNIEELLMRFEALGVNLPKTKSSANFLSYLQMKLYLIIHNALSRQHQPHANSDINAIMKQVKNFSQIKKEEKQLLKNHHSEIDNLMKPLQFIKLVTDKK